MSSSSTYPDWLIHLNHQFLWKKGCIFTWITFKSRWQSLLQEIAVYHVMKVAKDTQECLTCNREKYCYRCHRVRPQDVVNNNLACRSGVAKYKQLRFPTEVTFYKQLAIRSQTTETAFHLAFQLCFSWDDVLWLTAIKASVTRRCRSHEIERQNNSNWFGRQSRGNNDIASK